MKKLMFGLPVALLGVLPAGAADLVTVASETGVVTWTPSALVTPVLGVAASAIVAGVSAFLIWKGLKVVRRGLAAMGI